MVFKKWWETTNRQIAEVGHRRCDYFPTIVLKPSVVISSSAEKRQSKWGSRDDHRLDIAILILFYHRKSLDQLTNS